MSRDQYFSKAMAFCTHSEKCISDVQKKMVQWDVSETDQEFIIDALIAENFINEERYASAFVNDKIKFNYWGKQKVRFQLLQKGLPSEVVTMCLQQFPDDIYFEIAEGLMLKKCAQLENDVQMHNKVIKYMFGKGFDYDLIRNILSKIDSSFTE